MPLQTPTKAPTPSPSPQAPSAGTGNSPQKADRSGDEQRPKRQPTQQEQPKQKKFGLLVMLWCLFWATAHYIVTLVLALFLLDDFMIADTIYGGFVTLPLMAYQWAKGIPGNAKNFISLLTTIFPYLAAFLPQPIYLLVIFYLTNSKSTIAKTAQTVGSKVPSPKGGGIPGKDGAGVSTLGK